MTEEFRKTHALRQVQAFERQSRHPDLMGLARHAALPVALNSELLHLLRVNFFLDTTQPLPFTAETDLLFSPLVEEIGEDLFEIRPEVRDILLKGLVQSYPPRRIREIATLLWQYTRRSFVWNGRAGLERAQQLTAVYHLNPEAAKQWLADAEKNAESEGAASREWFVAMREELSRRENRQNKELRIHDPYWSLKLERITQYSKVSYLTRLMLKERKPKINVFIWYGMEGQGVDMFAERLKIELQEELDYVNFYEINPIWPLLKIDPNRSFDDMILEAFDFDPNNENLNHIPGRIRSYAQGRHYRQTLVYIRHQPLKTNKIIGIKELKVYFEWLEIYLAPMLEKNVFVICGVSYILPNPSKLASVLENKVVEPLVLKRTAIHLLEELDKVTKRDLLEFLKNHNIKLPPSLMDDVLEKIIKKTHGAYDATLVELKNIISRPYDIELDEERGDDDDDDMGFGEY